jgi:hypothetical protein
VSEKPGAVQLFQFAHWFTVRRDNIDYLQQLRERLKWPIAVEFRGGGWMTNNYRARTLSLLEKLGMLSSSAAAMSNAPVMWHGLLSSARLSLAPVEREAAALGIVAEVAGGGLLRQPLPQVTLGQARAPGEFVGSGRIAVA